MPTWADAYEQNLVELIAALRADLGSALMPTVAGLIATDYGWPYAATVRGATARVAEEVDRVAVTETDDLGMTVGQTAHYDEAGYLVLGERFANAVAAFELAPLQ